MPTNAFYLKLGNTIAVRVREWKYGFDCQKHMIGLNTIYLSKSKTFFLFSQFANLKDIAIQNTI